MALAFDASDGEPRRLEDPMAKVATRPDVDAAQLAVVGICEGASVTLRVAVDDPRVTAVATVSGHYRDADNDIALVGGKAFDASEVERAEVVDWLAARKARGVEAMRRFEDSGEVDYGVIVDPERNDVALPRRMIWEWYHGWAVRGLWENRYALMSDVPYFAFESLSAAEKLSTPLLMVHADFCDGPDSARRHFAAVPGSDKHLAWQGRRRISSTTMTRSSSTTRLPWPQHGSETISDPNLGGAAGLPDRLRALALSETGVGSASARLTSLLRGSQILCDQRDSLARMVIRQASPVLNWSVLPVKIIKVAEAGFSQQPLKRVLAWLSNQHDLRQFFS